MSPFANDLCHSRADRGRGRRPAAGVGAVVLALGLVALETGAAVAATATFSFSGVFTSASISGAGAAGGTFSGTLSLPSDAVGSGSTGPGTTNDYSPSPASLSISTEYGTFSLSAPAIQVQSDQYTWKLVTDTADYGDNNVLRDGNPSGPGFINFQLGGGWLNGNSYAYAPGYNGVTPDLTSGLLANLSALSFVQVAWTDGAFGNDLTGHLTALSQVVSPVPVPPTLPLSASAIGLLGCIGLRRRRRLAG